MEPHPLNRQRFHAGFPLLLILLEISANALGDARGCCSCEDGILNCYNMTSEVDLHLKIGENDKCHAPGFRIERSTMRYIYSDSFRGSKINSLFVEDSSLMSLTDKDTALLGLENSLHRLTVMRSEFVDRWNWAHLNHLHSLTYIAVYESDIEYPVSFENLFLNSLQWISLSMNEKLTVLPTYAFAKLNGLSYIILQSNSIESVARTMFPNYLRHIELGQNNIRTLPVNLFRDMPLLEEVHLEGNKLVTIDEDVFKDAWAKLVSLRLADNPIICDCHLMWIFTSPIHLRIFSGNCVYPSDFKGKKIVNLDHERLWC